MGVTLQATAAPLTILVVEDDLCLLMLYEIVISAWAIAPKVTVAENGLTALHLLSCTLPDILILDLNLPDCDGLALVRQLRSDPRLQPVTMVVVSGTTSAAIDSRGGLPADVVCMQKPVHFSQLQALAEAVARGPGDGSLLTSGAAFGVGGLCQARDVSLH